MLARRLRRYWRRYSLRDSEQLIPPGCRSGDSAADRSNRAPLFDPQDPVFAADPYPLFERLREQDPVHRGATGAWVLSRYQDVSDALIDERLGNAPSEYATVNPRNRERYTCARVANNILPFLDPPQHVAPRKLITQSFHQFLRQREPDLRALAESCWTTLATRDEFDLLADYATPFAALVFARLLDLPRKDLPQLLEWSHWFFYLLTVIPSQQARISIDASLESFCAYLDRVIETRRAAPGDDYISHLLRANADSSTLSQDQLRDNLILLFADGVGNVDRGIAATVALLLQHPGQRRQLQSQPELLPQAIDESLRFESPGQFIGRVALEDLEIGGCSIRRNDAVILLLGSANRDPAVFERPDRFDITRFPNPHLAFGRSRHACVGGPLVRSEIRAAIEPLLPEFDRLETVDPALDWEARTGHRWLASLRLRRERKSA